MHTSPLSCPRCGTVVSVGGGRCPNCGAQQLDPGAPLSQRLTPHAPFDPPDSPPTGLKRALPLVLLVVGLGGIGALAVLLAPDSSSAPVPAASLPAPAPAEPSSSAAPIDPDDLGITDRSAASPYALLGRAKTRALAWSQDAVLVSIRAKPVLAHAVDLTHGGSIVYEFGRPTGPGFGENAHLAKGRLFIEVGKDDTTVRERAGAAAHAAMEPNCPLEEAVSGARASGLSAGAPLEITYRFSTRYDKAVWFIREIDEPDKTRAVDGWTCAILVR